MHNINISQTTYLFLREIYKTTIMLKHIIFSISFQPCDHGQFAESDENQQKDSRKLPEKSLRNAPEKPKYS